MTFDDGLLSVVEALPILERLNLAASVFICPSYAETGRAFSYGVASGAAGHPDVLRTLTWDDLRNLADRGVVVGSHSMTHPHLTGLSDAELRAELVDSKESIEAELGQRCRFFAYPFGDEDPRVRTAVERAGYEAAFGAPGRELGYDRYSVPRVLVGRGDRSWRLALKTSPIGRRFLALTRRARGRPRSR